MPINLWLKTNTSMVYSKNHCWHPIVTDDYSQDVHNGKEDIIEVILVLNPFSP